MGITRFATIMLSMVIVLFAGCAFNSDGPKELACAITEIEWKITNKAQLTDFQCKLSDNTTASALIFSADVINTTTKPLRYRLSIVLPDFKKAIGHLVPRKGVPPVVMPGDSEKVILAIEKTTGWPQKAEVTLIVLPEQPEIPDESETPKE